MRVFAGRLMACEAARNDSSGTDLPAAFRVCMRLRPRLAVFVGKTGFHTLLSRVLALSAEEAPVLRSVRVTPDGLLETADELKAQADPGRLEEGGIILLAHLLGLLEAFIGEDLTVQIVRGVWPELSPADVNIENRIQT